MTRLKIERIIANFPNLSMFYKGFLVATSKFIPYSTAVIALEAVFYFAREVPGVTDAGQFAQTREVLIKVVINIIDIIYGTSFSTRKTT